jgi:branched-chain amino acid transport system ATP-binding protein
MGTIEIKNLKKSFEGINAVDGVNLNVEQGELVAIIGPNGSGKTTLFNLITGFLRPDFGKIYFKGEEISNLPSHRIVKKGISRTFQLVNIFNTLTILENVLMGVLSSANMTRNMVSNVSKLTHINEEALLILEKVGLSEFKDFLANSTPHGYQKCLEIAIALSHKADLLLLDEPTSGTNPEETARLMSTIENVWRQNNLTILLVEHDMEVVFSLARRVVVMNEGKIIADGDPEIIEKDADVRRLYLGA